MKHNVTLWLVQPTSDTVLVRVGRKAGLIGIETHRAGTHVVGVGYALDTSEKNMQFNSESHCWLIITNPDSCLHSKHMNHLNVL